MSSLYDDIMTPTGNRNKIIITSHNVFSNSEAMFIEYNDVISAPWYVFILNLIKKENASDYFSFPFDKNTNNLEGILFDWYTKRKYINPFFSIGLKPTLNSILRNNNDYEKSRIDFLTNFLTSSMNKSPEMFSSDGYLNFADSLTRIICIKNLVKKIYIYSERYYDGIKNDIMSLYGDNVIYIYGDIIDILSDDTIPKDTTYVFSDIYKVYALKDTNRLNNASILISDKFGYNYNNDNRLILNLDILKDDKFKLNTFDNIHQLELK
jgi:hypothetical protein